MNTFPILKMHKGRPKEVQRQRTTGLRDKKTPYLMLGWSVSEWACLAISLVIMGKLRLYRKGHGQSWYKVRISSLSIVDRWSMVDDEWWIKEGWIFSNWGRGIAPKSKRSQDQNTPRQATTMMNDDATWCQELTRLLLRWLFTPQKHPQYNACWCIFVPSGGFT